MNFKPIVSVEKFVPIGVAIEILGESRVVTAKRVAEKLGISSVLEPKLVGYAARKLEEAAAANEVGHRHRLIYCRGISLADHIGMRLPQHPQVILKENLTEWLDQISGNLAAHKVSRPGYYLINFAAASFQKKTFSEQEAAIAEMGIEFERPADALLLEAALTLMTAVGEPPFALADHWGHLQWNGLNIVFGPSSREGIEIRFINPTTRYGRGRRPLGACVARLPQHILRSKIREL